MNQNPHRDTAKLMTVAGFVLLIGLMTVLFGDLLERQRNPNRNIAVTEDREGNRVVRLQRNAMGHYFATGRINGQPVEFLLDTGATDVAVPAQLATRLGLRRGVQRPVSTANGIAYAYETHIDEISLGPITQTDVEASITPGLTGEQILLGMSFLKNLSFSQQGSTLIIEAPDAYDAR